jgi:GTP-binding protein
MPREVTVYESEYDPDDYFDDREEPVTYEYDPKAREYVVEGPRIEKMLGYTNLDTEKGFMFFQNFIRENGIVEKLKEMGCKEGDTVRMYGHAFDFFD